MYNWRLRVSGYHICTLNLIVATLADLRPAPPSEKPANDAAAAGFRHLPPPLMADVA